MIKILVNNYFDSVNTHLHEAVRLGQNSGVEHGMYYLWANSWAFQNVTFALLLLFVLFSVLVVFPLQVYNIILLSKIKTYIKKRGQN